jgi:hypothetical protein
LALVVGRRPGVDHDTRDLFHAIKGFTLFEHGLATAKSWAKSGQTLRSVRVQSAFSESRRISSPPRHVSHAPVLDYDPSSGVSFSPSPD